MIVVVDRIAYVVNFLYWKFLCSDSYDRALYWWFDGSVNGGIEFCGCLQGSKSDLMTAMRLKVLETP